MRGRVTASLVPAGQLRGWVGVVVSHSLALSDPNAAAALFPQTNVPCEERIHYELVVQYLSSYVML